MLRCMVLGAMALVMGLAGAVDTDDTLLLQMPDVSAQHITFVYDNSVWIAERNGDNARRLTTAEGEEVRPRFSPDGSLIAFTGNYDGNRDVYVMPVAGGPPRRLTYHPGTDLVRGFTPDGGAVLFQSARAVHTRRHAHLYTVSINGGMPDRLPVPTGFKAALSPDGKRIAYSPLAERFAQWKNYRGGAVSRIWIMDLDSHEVVEVPQPEGRSNDTDPRWLGDTLYFNSDRHGEFNLFRFNAEDGSVTQLTRYHDFPVIEAESGDGGIVFEQAGHLRWFDPESGEVATLRVGVGADLREARSRWASDTDWVRDASPANGGQRVALEYRGEIITVPARHGDPRNLSQSPGAHDRSPAWSPDGARVAWFSDQGGEYALHVAPQDGDGEARRFELDGAGFYFDPEWSPDSRHIAYRDNALRLYVIDTETGGVREVAREPVYSPIVTMSYDWSPDSRWLAYTINQAGMTQTVYLYSLGNHQSHPVTDGLAEMSEPVFDPNGKYLYMLGSTNAGPLKDWFAQSSLDMQVTHQVYAVTLSAEADNPVPPRSDEVKPANGDKAGKGNGDDNDGGKDKNNKDIEVVVDFEGLTNRIQPLVTDSRNLRNLRVGASGEIYFLETVGRTSFATLEGPGELKRFSLEDRDTTVIGRKIDGFEITEDGKHLLYVRDGTWHLVKAGGKIDPDKGKLNLAAVQVMIDPRAEWQQIFDEAWRINRDYFYATNYHGADWDAVRDKYRPLIAHAANRDDVERIIRWMASELAVGHSYSGSGDTIEDPEDVGVGLLGADYESDDGRYRLARVYGGLNWTPEITSPLKTAGVNVTDGEYLLAVDGEPLRAGDNLFQRFENTVGKQVLLRVGPRADGRDSREVTVVPIANERALRNRAWVEGNIKKVHEASDGRVAYVYVPNTAGTGHEFFKRYFYPQSHLDAIIVDERYNGGGLFSDYYIDILRRPFAAYWAMRYGDDLVTPRGALYGPKVMITDETAGSGGDLLPWMFRKYDLGPLIGKRTWGGLVGILGFPVLMDGGTVTAPNLAIWDENGWIVENQGVPPDIEVEQWPSAVNRGRDPQLEKAIEVVLEMLRENPTVRPERPPFPERAN